MTIAEQVTQLKQDFYGVRTAGYRSGRAEGLSEGYREGRADGWSEGHSEGYSEGYNVGEEKGLLEGARNERQAFWKQIQQEGTRWWCAYMFAYWGEGDCYDPQYPFYDAYIASMFTQSGITDTKQPITSRAMIADGLFSGAKNLIRVPYLDITLATTVKNAFHNCNNLMDITFGGEIRLSLDMHWSTLLSKDSIESTVKALSENVSGQTLTLSRDAVLDAFGSTGDGSDWATLIAPKQSAGWTITLV